MTSVQTAEYQEKVRATLLVGIMILSVLAVGVGFVGTASAAAGNVSVDSPTDVDGDGDIEVRSDTPITVSVDVSAQGNSATFAFTDDTSYQTGDYGIGDHTGTAVNSYTVQDGGANDQDGTTDGTVTVEVYAKAGTGSFSEGDLNLGVSEGTTISDSPDITLNPAVHLDETPPSVNLAETLDSSGDGNVDQIRVFFTEDLEDAKSSLSASDFTLSSGSVDSVHTGSSDNDNVISLEVSGFSGTAVTPDINSDANPAEFQDEAGNSLTVNSGNVVTATTDAAPPSIKSATTTDTDDDGNIDTIDVTMSESVDDANSNLGTADDHFSVNKGTVDTVSTGSTTDDNTLVLTISGATGTDTRPEVTQEGGATPIEDLNGNSNADTPWVKAFDGAAPQITDFAYEDGDSDGKIDQFTVSFSETISTNSNLGADDLQLDNNGDFTGASFGTASDDVVSSDTSSVTVPLGSTSTEVTTTDTSGSIAISAVAGNGFVLEDTSFSANTYSTTGTEATDQATYTDGAAPVITDATYTDTQPNGQVNQINVVYSEDISASTLESEDWAVTGNDAGSPDTAASTISTDTVQLAVTGTPTLDTNVDLKVEYLDSGTPGSITDGSNPASGSGTVSASDNAAPYKKSVEYKDTDTDGELERIDVAYTEMLASGADAGDYAVTGTDSGLISSVDSASVNNDVVEVGVTADAVNTGPSLTLDYTAGAAGSNTITDPGSNAAPDFTNEGVTDKASPIVTSAAYRDSNTDGQVDKADVVFSEAISSYTPASPISNDWSPTPNDLTGLSIDAKDTVSSDTVTLDVSADAGLTGVGVGTEPRLDYAEPGGGSLVDSAGLEAVFSGKVSMTDNAAPRITDATTADTNDDGHVDEITVTMSEPIDDAASNIGSANDHFRINDGALAAVETGTADDNTLIITRSGGTDGTGFTPNVGQDGVYGTLIKDSTGNSYTTTASVTASDGAAPQANTPSLDTSTITDAETGDGNEVRLTVSFNEPMATAAGDVTVTPDANGDLSTTPTVENKQWKDGTTFLADIQFADDGESISDVTLEVDGAKDANGNQMSSAVSTTYDIDTTNPTTTDPPTLDTTTITDSETGDGNEVRLTVSFNEPMATAVGDVTVTPDADGNLSTTPAVENKQWKDSQTFLADIQFTDDNEAVSDVTLQIDGAKDTNGNEMSSSASTTYDVDTTNPSTSSGSSISTGYTVDEEDSTTTTEDEVTEATITGYEIGSTLSIQTQNADTETIEVEQVDVSFDMGTNVPNEISIEADAEPPQGVPAYTNAEQADYVSVNIDGNLADRVTSGTITVQVADDRMPDDPALVKVYHEDADEWTQVDRTYTGNNTFKVHTSSFSTFAVVVEDTTEPTTTTTTTTTTQPTTQQPTTTTTTEPATITDTPTTETPTATTTETSTPGFGVIVALISLLGAALLARRP